MQTIDPPPLSILVCVNRRSNGIACGNHGGELIAARLEQLLSERGMAIPVERIHCLGECTHGPNARIAPGGAMFHHLDPAQLDALIAAIEEVSVQP